MPISPRATFLIDDARSLHGDALEMLTQGRVRNAAEKAWGATKRATDALVLELTGREPTRTSQTSSGLKALARDGVIPGNMWERFRDRVQYLHAQCFYDGRCYPTDFMSALIEDTAGYIRDAEEAANTPE